MRVLSLFDGISCAKMALDRAGIDYESYTAIEIDEQAALASDVNFKGILRPQSDVRLYKPEQDKESILIGGSPCQDLSIACKDRKGLEGNKSGLFWEYVRVRDELKPKWFILENVNSMKKADRDVITKTLGVKPIMIDAAKMSAQSRKRFFWTNIPYVAQPKDRGIYLKDIMKPTECLTGCYPLNPRYGWIEKPQRYVKILSPFRVGYLKNNSQGNRVYSTEGKSVTLSASSGGYGRNTGLYEVHSPETKVRIARRLYVSECKALQGIPVDFVMPSSDTQCYKQLGNAFNVDVIAHILSHLKGV